MQTVSVGDVVLVNFPYEDDPSKMKIRPAVIIATETQELKAIALKVTSTPPRDLLDYQLISWALSGLHRPSTVRTSKRVVIDYAAIIKKLGTLSNDDFTKIMTLYKGI
jgi:mRNA-degrading endonuclease toxin of MazEF toxin-antitoxin module